MYRKNEYRKTEVEEEERALGRKKQLPAAELVCLFAGSFKSDFVFSIFYFLFSFLFFYSSYYSLYYSLFLVLFFSRYASPILFTA